MGDEDKITMEATVSRFIADAMSDDFVSGKFMSFDAVELLVSKPPDWKGKSLVVYLSPGSENKKLLSQPSRRLRFSIQSVYLAGDRTLFDGALLELVEINA